MQDWFKVKEKVGLKVLQDHYPLLTEYAKKERETYEKYIREWRKPAKRLGKQEEVSTRQILYIVAKFILGFDAGMNEIIVDHELRGKPKTLTQALGLFDLFIDNYGEIDDISEKVLFLLLAGIETKMI